MPWPIRPPPTTPTFEISISLRSPVFESSLRASGAYMGLVGIEDRDAVRHIVMQRPEKRNALHEELVRGLGEAFEAAAADTAVRCVVVRGAGPMFSSGMDLADLRTLSERPDQLRQFRSGILRVWNLLEEMPKPTICQIHGACIGGAMELALAADLRVMAEDAVAGLLET